MPVREIESVTNYEANHKVQSSNLDQIAKTLPQFLTLYKPFGQVAAIGRGLLGSAYAFNELKNLIQQGQPIPSGAVLNAIIETGSLAATVFFHPVGMLIAAGKDLVTETDNMTAHLDAGRYTEAMESGAKVLGNALYLSAIAVGSVQISIASLALQIGLGLYSAKKAYSQGSYIEAAGHIAMTLILGKQVSSLAAQIMPIEEKDGPVKALPVDALDKTEKPQAITPPKDGKAGYTVHANSAQYKGSDYSNAVRVERGITLNEAKKIANSDPEIAYFFRVRRGRHMHLETDRNPSSDPLGLMNYGLNPQNHWSYGPRDVRSFGSGDTVFFKDTSKMWLGAAPGRADTYVKNS